MSIIVSSFALVGIDITTISGCYAAIAFILAMIVILSLKGSLFPER